MWGNAFIKDISATNISVSGNLNATSISGTTITPISGDGQGSIGLIGSRWGNAYIRDLSVVNISVSGNITASGNIVPFINTSGSLGVSGRMWGNAFIKDISATNISVSGNLVPLIVDNNSTLGSITNYWRNAYIRDLSVANITISGNMLSQNNTSQVPVSYSTFSVVSAQNRSIPPYINTTPSNEWIQAYAYDISKVVLSNRSVIKIEVKVNYTASPEADQTLSFRVRESSNNGLSYIETPVFSDISLGSSMGVTINNIYNGSYYDDLSGITLTGNIITYRLEFRRDCPPGNTIKTGYGIQASSGNYISLQELYKPP